MSKKSDSAPVKAEPSTPDKVETVSKSDSPETAARKSSSNTNKKRKKNKKRR